MPLDGSTSCCWQRFRQPENALMPEAQSSGRCVWSAARWLRAAPGPFVPLILQYLDPAVPGFLCRVLSFCLLALGPGAAATAQPEPAAGPFAAAIDAARQRVVKLYGGALGAERGFGSGVLVAPDGRIVTTLSVLLESPGLRAVLFDGRRFPAQVVARDEQRQLALLQIQAAELPYFELGGSGQLQTGDWVIAVANPFKVADGPEPVSVAVGVLSGRSSLSARRRTQDFAYDGTVLLIDVIVATPGSAGGAVVDACGRLVGLIGKAVIDTRTNTWANYALPVEEVAAFLRQVAEGTGQPARATPHAATPAERVDLGIRLFDVGGRTRPAYVERVRPDSPAWRAGIRPDDLIVALDAQPIGTCQDFYRACDGLRADAGRIEVVVKRGDELQSFAITIGESE